MIASYRLKLHLTIVVFMLFLTVSCNVPPYVQEPTATPEPTAIPVGPYIVAVKDSGSKTMISDPVFWVGANRIKKSDIVFDGNGYHLFCNTGERLSIWADGFFIKQIVCQGETAPVEIFLDRYQLTDNANYVWTGSNACAACHTDRTDELTGRYHNEYSEWLSDPHSKSYANPFFQSIYLGTNGPPGFLSDYPADFGNCAFCHVPAVLDPPQREADLRNFFFTQPSPATEGVTCDVCHKVVSVNLQASGENKSKPYHDRPGVLDYNFLRPEPQTLRLYVGPRIFANLEDFTGSDPSTSRLTYSSVFERSEFCAPCHYGKFWDTEVYNSYGEWLASAYAREGTTCQACHMQPGYLCDEGEEINVPQGDFTHNMTVEDCMLKKAATMEVNASYEKERDRIAVAVTLTNENAGHNFPTDSPLRQLILVVEARDQNGNVLPQVGGDMIPLWGGVGNVAGRPGKIFANLLVEETFTNRQIDISPTTAYWNKTKPAWKNADSRLKPKVYNSENNVESVPDKSQYYFAAPYPVSGKLNATVTVRLYYRYAFFDLMLRKGWNRPDITLIEWMGVVQ